jgi:hypothetical protein
VTELFVILVSRLRCSLAINRQTILQYKSFGKQQLRAAMEEHVRVSKKFYHSKRLYMEALEMLEGKVVRADWWCWMKRWSFSCICYAG